MKFIFHVAAADLDGLEAAPWLLQDAENNREIGIAANKHKGIRAALCSDTFSARMTRMHNNANVLCLGARVIGVCLAEDIVDAFLAADFESGGRHEMRVNMMKDIEAKN